MAGSAVNLADEGGESQPTTASRLTSDEVYRLRHNRLGILESGMRVTPIGSRSYGEVT